MKVLACYRAAITRIQNWLEKNFNTVTDLDQIMPRKVQLLSKNGVLDIDIIQRKWM